MHNLDIVPENSRDYLNSWSFIMEIFSVFKSLDIQRVWINNDSSIEIRFRDQVARGDSFHQSIENLEAILDTKLDIEHKKPDLVKVYPLSFKLQSIHN